MCEHAVDDSGIEAFSVHVDGHSGATERVLGYTDVISGRPGDSIQIKTSTRRAHVDLSFQRLTGPVGETGEGRVVAHAPAAGRYPAMHQSARVGSALVISHLPPLWSFAVDVAVMPTALDQHQQGVVTWCRGGVPGLFLDAQGVTLRLVDQAGAPHSVTLDFPFENGVWTNIRAEYQSTSGLVKIVVATRSGTIRTGEGAVPAGMVLPPTPAAIGAGWSDGILDDFFNGRIAAPSVSNAAKKIAAWDFSRGDDDLTILDTTGNGHHAWVHNAPIRAVPGPDWDGRPSDPAAAPEQFDAIHFHEESIEDYGWETTATLVVPDDWTSGIYLAVLDDGETRDELPLWIGPAAGAESPVLFLAPTNTYLAHANDRRFGHASDTTAGSGSGIGDGNDSCLAAHPELGISLYDKYRDGYDCVHASRLRPMLNLRPGRRNWQTGSLRHLDADLVLIALLERAGISYSVATDEDLDREGAELLRPYRAVCTGSHPEYYTETMLDAVETYLSEGGHLAYLGGGGFYRVTSYPARGRHLIEARRGNPAEPGEVENDAMHHSTTGEPGGIWRRRGRGPHALVGVGLTANGWVQGRPYERTRASYEPQWAWIFEGIELGDFIGEGGMVLGAAAGGEVDRYDQELGSSYRATVLATARGFDARYRPVSDAGHTGVGGIGGDDDVRADLVVYETASGGAVFAVGSTAWIGSIADRDYRCSTARVTLNVLNRFVHRGTVPLR